mgnify:CR=1 FL=1
MGAHGIATLLFDLLTPREDQTYETRFDIGLLSTRALLCMDWVGTRKELATLALGLFGASTGAAAALRGGGNHQREQQGCSTGNAPDLHVTSHARPPDLPYPLSAPTMTPLTKYFCTNG